MNPENSTNDLKSFLEETKQARESDNRKKHEALLAKWSKRFPHLKTESELMAQGNIEAEKFRKNWNENIAPILETIWDKKPEECTPEDVRFIVNALIINDTEKNPSLSETELRKNLIEDLKTNGYPIPEDILPRPSYL